MSFLFEVVQGVGTIEPPRRENSYSPPYYRGNQAYRVVSCEFGVVQRTVTAGLRDHYYSVCLGRLQRVTAGVGHPHTASMYCVMISTCHLVTILCMGSQFLAPRVCTW